jgi:hypothetical protein
MSSIEFINTFDIEPSFFPEPSLKNLPEWYIRTAMEMDPQEEAHLVTIYGDKANTRNTVKRCTPVQDIIGAGYILKTPFDLIVKNVDGIPYYEWPSRGIDAVYFHPAAQLKHHPLMTLDFAPKWNNPWGVKTPLGYSCLFAHPFHHDDLPFTSLSGIVDTDGYTAPVNMPFVLKDPNFQGLIPAGTPFCQVIPFKREPWEMKIGNKVLQEEARRLDWRMNKIPELRYKLLYWNRKYFK